jgi:hypothetical protein
MYGRAEDHSYHSVLLLVAGRYRGHEGADLSLAMLQHCLVPGSRNADAMNDEKVKPNKYLLISERHQIKKRTHTNMIVTAIPPPLANPYSLPCLHIHTPVVPSQIPVIANSNTKARIAEYQASPPVTICPFIKKVVKGFSKLLYRLSRSFLTGFMWIGNSAEGFSLSNRRWTRSDDDLWLEWGCDATSMRELPIGAGGGYRFSAD